jgi:hypothetical protein
MTDIFAELSQAILGAEPPQPPPPAPPAPPAPMTIVSVSPGSSVGNVNGIRGAQAKAEKAPEFPPIPPDFGSTLSIAVRETATSAVPQANMDRSDRLEVLVDKALIKAEELLGIELVPGSEDFIKTASMQKDLVVSLVNTGVKVDENRFKKRQGDALTGILANLIEREKKIQPLIDITPTVGTA